MESQSRTVLSSVAFAAVIVFCLAAADAFGDDELWHVTASRLNVRSGPSMTSPVELQFVRGETVKINAASGVWRHVYGRVGSGWVHAAYLAPGEGKARDGLDFKAEWLGYELRLRRTQAEKLDSFLDEHVSTERVVRILVRILRRPVDAEIKITAALIAGDVLLFKYKLKENMGADGVVLRVWGRALLDDLPMTYRFLYETFVDEDTRNKITIGTTIPVFWTIRPRND